jgi:hypothetical protein
MPKKINNKHMQPANDQAARRLMWVGVASFSLIIVFFWAWSLKLQLSSFSWQGSEDKAFLDQATTDFNQAFNNEDGSGSTELSREIDKLHIKNTLSQIMAKQAAEQKNVSAELPTTTELEVEPTVIDVGAPAPEEQ